MTSASRLQPHFLALLCTVSILAAGCAGSGSAVVSEPETAPVMIGPSMLVSDSDGLARVARSGDGREVVQPSITFAGLYRSRSMNRDAVITVRSGGVTKLALLSSDGSLKTIHEQKGNTTYTVAWSPDGDLAFGYEASTGRGIGLLGRDGQISNVGCSSSSRALGWVNKERLIVADANNHYVVSANGCTTIGRVDSRKMHEEAFNPNHATVAYILRELEYDRNARQYVPDSSLHIAGVDGSNPQLVAGNRYLPHRPEWSPGGDELAFDARIPDQPTRRLISIYDTERGSAAFLNPSLLEGLASEWDAHWSPGGTHIAYMQRIGEGEPTVTVRPMESSFTVAVGESGERFARWIDDKYLVVTNGTNERIVSTNGETSIPGPGGATILGLE